VSELEFMRLIVFSAKSRLDGLREVRDFLIERFGSSQGGFQAVDETRGGSVGVEVFVDVMDSHHGYRNKRAVRACWDFMNIHRRGALIPKDFEVLETLDADKFLADVNSLKECLLKKHGSMEKAYHKFVEEAASAVDDAGRFSRQQSRATSRAMSRQQSDARSTAAAANAGGSKGLSPQDFLSGCRSSGYQGSFDARYIFNFLDPACAGYLSVSDFALVGELAAIDRMQRLSVVLHTSITGVRAFATAPGDDEEKESESGDKGEADPWASLHARLRAATHHDLFA